jgi:hypothetical protein
MTRIHGIDNELRKGDDTHCVILAAMDAATPPNQNGYGCFFFLGGAIGAVVPVALNACCALISLSWLLIVVYV